MPAGALATAWAAQVRTACGSWSARRDLTVTAAVALVAPLADVVDLELTVADAGTRSAVLGLEPGDGEAHVTALAPGPVRLPAGGGVRLGLRVALDRCDAVSQTQWLDPNAPPPTTQTTLGLLADVGAPVARASSTPWSDGTGATGVVLAPRAAATVDGALQQACGDLGGFAVLIAPGGVNYDAATRVLAVRLQVDGTPGRMHDVTLVSDPPLGGQGFAPAWSTTGALRPDYTGQVTTTVRYRAPGGAVCGRDAVVLPGFGVRARVAVPAGLRTVSYAGFAVPWQDTVVLAAVCPHA